MNNLEQVYDSLSYYKLFCAQERTQSVISEGKTWKFLNILYKEWDRNEQETN